MRTGKREESRLGVLPERILCWPPTVPRTPRGRRRVVGEDFSDDAREAGDLASAIGGLYGAGGLLLYSHPDLPEVPPVEARSTASNLIDMRDRDEEMLGERAGRLEELLGSKPEVRLSGGYPARVSSRPRRRFSPRSSPSAVGASLDRHAPGWVAFSTKVVTTAPGPVLVYPHVD